jgi:glycosyltransferase 2 family protein
MFKKILQFLVFASIGGVILFLVFRSQNAAFQAQCALDGVPTEQCSLFQKLASDFRSIQPFWMFGVLAAFTMSIVFRARRWQMQHEAIGYQTRLSTSFWSIILGYFANLGLPRMGEVVRAGALAKSDQVPVETVIGTLVIDRLMDFLCLFLVIFLAFIFEYDTLYGFLEGQGAFSKKQGGGPNLLLIAAGIGAVGLGGLYLLRDKIAQTAIGKKVLGMLAGFRAGIMGIFKMKNPLLFILLSLGIWFMFFLQCLFGLWSFPPTAHLTVGATLLVFVIGTFGFIIPSPGGMGTYHALTIAALSLYAINGADSFSYANIFFFTVQIFYNLIGGLIALFLMPQLAKTAI